jgi:hypothetical protein
MSGKVLYALCAVIFVSFGLASYSVTSAVAQPQYAWLHGFDARGREITLGELRGQVVAITFVGKNTRKEGTEVNEELGDLVEPGKMTLLSVIDLEGVPGIAHGMAMKKIAESDKPGMLHLVDDQGRLKQAFDVDPTKQVTILVLDREGAVRGRFDGEFGAIAAKKLVEQLKAS